MAHIVMRPHHPERGANQIVINGVDYSNEIYDFPELVSVDHPDHPELSEVGLRVTLVVSRLDLGEDVDVEITDRLEAVAQRVSLVARRADEHDPAAAADGEAPEQVDPGNLAAVLRQVADEYREQTVAIRELRQTLAATEQRIAALSTPGGAPRAWCEPQVTGEAHIPPAGDRRLADAAPHGVGEATAVAASQGARRQDGAR